MRKETPHVSRSQETSSPRRYERGSRITAAVAGGLLAVSALAACGPVNDAPRPVETSKGPETQAPTLDPIEALNLPVTLEELREMSPEEMKELTEISVESVQNSDGSIDWEEVVDRTYENYNIQVNAGATVGELNFVANQGLDFETYFEDKYGVPLESGYTSIKMGGLRSTHLNTITAADLQNIRTAEVSVRTIFINDGIEVISESETGSVVRVNERFTDNFFSSGAFQADDSEIISRLGRNSDANSSSVQEITYSIVDGQIVIANTSKVS